MVVFTCGHCGESVQKPKVEKHYLTKCRNRYPNLSCMDCFKDFVGKDYESHTKCISEEERYSGKGFMVKEKKGEKKQNAWVEMLQSVLDEEKDAPRNVLKIVEVISKHNNTPRKKPKFVNFVKNVCGNKTNQKDIDQAWDLISVKLSDLSNANAQHRDQNQKNGTVKPNDKTEEDETEIENGDTESQNGDTENGDVENGKAENGETENVKAENGENSDPKDEKKLSKKQRKEEKKRRKYEAELQSAEAQPEEDLEEEVAHASTKKGKKKNKSESSNGDVEETKPEGKGKNKKRKRQDTANSVTETPETTIENVENIPETKEKAQKKKLKVIENDEADESVCLHDQNVAKIEELSMKSDNFNWHGVIMSLLEKKGNELPFKRLQKKVLSEYSEATGRDVDDRIAEKFIKKLKSAPNVRVVKNTVTLIQ